MCIKAVLFDLDGTLANTIEDLASAVNYALSEYKFPLHSLEEYKYFVGNGIPKLIERSIPENCRDEKTVSAVKDKMLSYYTQHFIDKTCLYDGISDMLDTLKKQGIKMGVVTNKADRVAKLIIQSLAPDTFDYVCGLSDLYPSKPCPDSSLAILDKMGIEPKNCIFIGDSYVDIRTAAALGAVSIGVSWGFRDRNELLENGADYIVDTPEQIIKIIEQNYGL